MERVVGIRMRRTGAPPSGSLCVGWVLSRERVETDEELRDGQSK